MKIMYYWNTLIVGFLRKIDLSFEVTLKYSRAIKKSAGRHLVRPGRSVCSVIFVWSNKAGRGILI